MFNKIGCKSLTEKTSFELLYLILVIYYLLLCSGNVLLRVGFPTRSCHAVLLLHILQLSVQLLLIKLLYSLQLLQPLQYLLLLSLTLRRVCLRFRCWSSTAITLAFGNCSRNGRILNHIYSCAHQRIPCSLIGVPIGIRILLEHVRIIGNLEREPVRTLLFYFLGGTNTHRTFSFGVILTLHILSHLYLGNLHLHPSVLFYQFLYLS